MLTLPSTYDRLTGHFQVRERIGRVAQSTALLSVRLWLHHAAQFQLETASNGGVRNFRKILKNLRKLESRKKGPRNVIER